MTSYCAGSHKTVEPLSLTAPSREGCHYFRPACGGQGRPTHVAIRPYPDKQAALRALGPRAGNPALNSLTSAAWGRSSANRFSCSSSCLPFLALTHYTHYGGKGGPSFPSFASGSADESVKECEVKVAVRKDAPPSAAGPGRGPGKAGGAPFPQAPLVSGARGVCCARLKEGASGG